MQWPIHVPIPVLMYSSTMELSVLLFGLIFITLCSLNDACPHHRRISEVTTMSPAAGPSTAKHGQESGDNLPGFELGPVESIVPGSQSKRKRRAANIKVLMKCMMPRRFRFGVKNACKRVADRNKYGKYK